MNKSKRHIQSLVRHLLESLLKLYPPGFRREFSSEIQEIFLSRVREAEQLGGIAWLSAVFREVMGLILSIVEECWHELSFQKESAMVPEPYHQKVRFMKTIAYIRWADPPLWVATLASLLPLWLITSAFIARSMELGVIILVLAIAAIIVLLWLGWITPELILYSFFPFATLFLFEEMSVLYKIPFRILCAILLTAGIIGYRLSLHKDSMGFGWLTLAVFFIGTYILASNANQNYWQMTGNQTPWLVFFFSP